MRIILLTTFLCLGHFLFGQLFNRPVPDVLFQYEYSNTGFTGQGYFLATPIKLNSFPQDPDYMRPFPVVFDNDGYIHWYAKPNTGSCLDFKYYESADIYSLTYVKNGNPSFLILDNTLNPIDTLNVVDHWHDLHDIQLMDNGNWMLGTAFFDTMDLSAYTFDGTQGDVSTAAKGFGFQEFDASGTLINEWNSNDYILPTETYDYWGYSSDPFDYCHGNAIEEDVDGNILMSFRHLNAIYKVDRITGNVIWKLGGNSSDFVFTNDNGFSGQHDIRRTSDGYYSLFDNGNMGVPQVSRGVAYSLDTISWTATLVEEYIHPTNAYGRAMGNYQTTTDDFRVIGYGRIHRPDPSATIINNNETILAEYFFQDSVINYRMHYYEVDGLPKPEITCNVTQNGFELTVENANNYLWSTGETTQNIQLNSPGTYQVWVTAGFGSVGSDPFIVSDITNPCGNASLPELSGQQETYILFDLLGRKIETPQRNVVYIKRWSNGKSEKIFFTE